jgi:hypothetical protein
LISDVVRPLEAMSAKRQKRRSTKKRSTASRREHLAEHAAKPRPGVGIAEADPPAASDPAGAWEDIGRVNGGHETELRPDDSTLVESFSHAAGGFESDASAGADEFESNEHVLDFGGGAKPAPDEPLTAASDAFETNPGAAGVDEQAAIADPDGPSEDLNDGPAGADEPPQSTDSAALTDIAETAAERSRRRIITKPRVPATVADFELNPGGRHHFRERLPEGLRDAAEPERVREAVRMVVQEGRFVGDVARELGLAPSSIYRWEKRFLDFVSGESGFDPRAGWENLRTRTGASDLPEEWTLRFSDNWQRLLEATQAGAADFRQDPLELFLHNSTLTGWLFRDGRLDRYVALGAAVGVVLILILASFLHANSNPRPHAPSHVPGPNSAEIDQAEIALARPVALSYLRAHGWEAKARFVRDSDRVLPLMAAWYQSHSDAGQPDAELFYAMRSGELVNVMATFESSGGEPAFLSLVKEGGAYKVDWETSSGYQHESWAELVARRPSAPVLLRCVIERSDYFNFEFSDPEKWLCFEMRYPRGPVTLYGYVERRSTLGVHLDGLLEFKPHAGVVIEAAFPPEHRSNNQMRILKLVHEAWLPERSPDGTAD